jgi:hypothetical protein
MCKRRVVKHLDFSFLQMRFVHFNLYPWQLYYCIKNPSNTALIIYTHIYIYIYCDFLIAYIVVL